MRAALLALILSCATAQSADEAGRSRSLWQTIKRQLLAPDGDEFFERNVKNAVLPGSTGVHGLRGTVVSFQPALAVLALSDERTAEVAIEIDTSARVPVLSAGDRVEFQAVAERFQREPFLLTFGLYDQCFLSKVK